MAIIRAIVTGERNPQQLAALRHPRSRRTAAEIAQALHGDYRQEHLFILQQELALYDVYQIQLAACDQQIEQYLSSFDAKAEVPLPPAGSPPRKPQDNQPRFDLSTHLHRISGVDFTKIDGMGVLTVQTILSEIGLDPRRFPTVKHFTSWLGLCPGSNITGGKMKSSRTRLVLNRAEDCFSDGSSSRRQDSLCYWWLLSSFACTTWCSQSYHCYSSQTGSHFLFAMDFWGRLSRSRSELL